MQEWGGKRYDTDWYEIDAEGNRTGDQKDWGADRAHAETQPGGAWNFSPEVIAANPVASDRTRPTYGTPTQPLPAPGSGVAGAAPYGTAPNGSTAGGATNYQVPSANSPAPAWMNWQPPSEYDYNTSAMGNLLGAPATGTPPATAGTNAPTAGRAPAGSVDYQAAENIRAQQQGGGRLPPEQPPPGGWGDDGGGQVSAGGSPSFNEATGTYTTAGVKSPTGSLGGAQANPITATLGSAPQPGAPGSLENSLYSSVTNQINGPTTVDRNDPAYKQQIDAYNANNQRATDRQRAVAAQRAHATGTDASGGYDGMINRVTQDQGLNESAFEAQLMDRLGTQNIERQSRAQQLGAGLIGQDKGNALTREQMAQQNTQFGTGQRNALWMNNQGNQLQRELGLGDLGIRQQGLSLQQQLGLGDLDYRRDALGQQLALSQAGLNQQALMQLLNGY
jgi:hypothetical protein